MTFLNMVSNLKLILVYYFVKVEQKKIDQLVVFIRERLLTIPKVKNLFLLYKNENHPLKRIIYLSFKKTF